MTADPLADIAARHAGRGELDPWHAGYDVDPDELVDALVEQTFPPECRS